jgi:hypothetical protein
MKKQKLIQWKPFTRRSITWLAFILVGLIIFQALLGTNESFRAQAAPLAQIQIFTPTPGPDGQIIYVVKAGDSLISISIIMGVPVDELKRLNNLTDDNIIEGQKLLLGLAGPAVETVTPGPTPTPTPLLPTPSPRPGSGTLCIILFNDINGDSIRQEEEASIPDGAISINNRSGSTNITQATAAGLEPACFTEIPEGEYTVGVAVPAGFNPTTELSYIHKLGPGEETYIDFGAQIKENQTVEDLPVVTSGAKKTPVLAILGAVWLILGAGLAIFARQLMKAK